MFWPPKVAQYYLSAGTDSEPRKPFQDRDNSKRSHVFFLGGVISVCPNSRSPEPRVGWVEHRTVVLGKVIWETSKEIYVAVSRVKSLYVRRATAPLSGRCIDVIRVLVIRATATICEALKVAKTRTRTWLLPKKNEVVSCYCDDLYTQR